MTTTGTAEEEMKTPFAWTRSMVLETLWAGCAVFMPLVVIASVAVEAVPRVRGIAFVPQLRYALMTPACLISAVGAGFLYRFLKERGDRPLWALSASLCAIALLVLILMGIPGSPGLLTAAVPAVFGIAISLALLVPRSLEHPRRRVGTAVTVIFAVLEIIGIVAALSSERVAPPGGDVAAMTSPIFGRMVVISLQPCRCKTIWKSKSDSSVTKCASDLSSIQRGRTQ